ncbi:MAG TPA: gliding motility-associated ABC transporter substrate-binding protein GldG [Phnomibacter sp.]|nr:gliding motility-associated ABC transporter substrate-binding protein GldG [Phnomibacter sp.]
MLSNKFSWVIVLVAALGSIAMASYFNQRIDLTGEKRYTISPASKKLLNELQAPVEITVLLKDDNLSSGFRKLANSTESFLSDCRSISNGKLVYRFVAPDDFLADSIAFPLNDTFKITWLKSNAIKQNEVTKSGSAAVFHYPIALVKTGDDFTTVNLLEGQGNKGFLNPDAAGLQYETINNAEAQMEYLFASAIQTLSHREAPMVAYATGNGEPMGPETYDLSQTLQSKYRFFLLNLQQQPFISDTIKTLVIVKPSVAFSDADKLKIDQYVMRGGKVLFLLDALHADMDSLVRSGKDFTAYGRDLRIDDLIFKYGARINQNLVQDRQCDVLPQAVGNVGEQPQIELLPWPYFPLLYSQSSHPIAKNLDAVVMQFPNSIDTVKAEGINKTILLSTSNTSRILSAPAIVTVEILKQLENPSAFQQEAVPLAVLLEGHFKSLYANRLSKTVIDSLQAVGQPYLPTASKPGQVLVTGDGDWVLNGFTREGPLAMGTNPYTQYQFANRNFLLNAIDFMTDESGIMATRSKEYTLRLLDPKKLETGKGMWQAINIALPLLLLLLSGIVVNLVRRKKYS